MTRKAAKPDKAGAAPAAPPTPRPPTPAEAEAIRQASEKQRDRPARVSMRVQAEGAALALSNPHADLDGWSAHVGETFGTASPAFSTQSFARIASAVADRQKPVTEMQANAALALMGAIAPANELEAAIGEQIIAAHTASLDFLQRARLNAGEYRDTAVAYAGAATKLTRTMGALIETLAKLRNGGQQRIEVVYVNGPAVIGDNTQTVVANGDGGTIVGQPHATGALALLAAATSVPMRCPDPERVALPVSSHEGSEAVPDARG